MKNKIVGVFQAIKKAWAESYTKRIVSLIVVNAILWIWASYALAFLGRVEIAEDLAGKVVTAIIGVVITYAAKALTENISKYRKDPDETSRDDNRKDI